MSEETKGLKFYLCQTPAGPQYVHLQADAKKIDPSYETVYIDTSKQALMERLNELMRGPIKGISDFEEEEDEEPVRPVVVPVNNPLRTPAVQVKMERVYDQIGFEEFIYTIPKEESYRLDQLMALVESARWYLENPGQRRQQQQQPEAAPAARKPWGK